MWEYSPIQRIIKLFTIPLCQPSSFLNLGCSECQAIGKSSAVQAYRTKLMFVYWTVGPVLIFLPSFFCSFSWWVDNDTPPKCELNACNCSYFNFFFKQLISILLYIREGCTVSQVLSDFFFPLNLTYPFA